MDNEIKRELLLLKNKGALTNGAPTSVTFDNTTDAQEMLSDKLGAFTGDGGAGQDDSVKSSLDLVNTDTDSIISEVAKVPKSDGAVSWNATALAAIQSEANDALVANNIDHLEGTAVANNADMTVEVPDGTVLSNMLSKTSDTSTYVVATDSLEAISDKLGTPAAASLAADILAIDNFVDDLETRVTVARATTLDFAESILEVSVTAAANAGLTTVATVNTQPCQIESIVIHADAAQTADMTSCAVKGGASQVVTFVDAASATQANLNAADKQVSWTGAVRLAATKTVVIDLQGTGATAVDLTIAIKYRACVAGGTLS